MVFRRFSDRLKLHRNEELSNEFSTNYENRSEIFSNAREKEKTNLFLWFSSRSPFCGNLFGGKFRNHPSSRRSAKRSFSTMWVVMNRAEFSKLISARTAGVGDTVTGQKQSSGRQVCTRGTCVQGRVATALYPALSRAALADDVPGFYPFWLLFQQLATRRGRATAPAISFHPLTGLIVQRRNRTPRATAKVLTVANDLRAVWFKTERSDVVPRTTMGENKLSKPGTRLSSDSPILIFRVAVRSFQNREPSYFISFGVELLIITGVFDRRFMEERKTPKGTV